MRGSEFWFCWFSRKRGNVMDENADDGFCWCGAFGGNVG